MSGKKKKFNSRFPPARIKKMMQSDEDVGKVAWVVPCLISKALEIFAEQLMVTISDEIHSRNARTLSTAHIKTAIKMKNEFIAVRELAEGESNGDSTEFPEIIDGSTAGPGGGCGSAIDGQSPRKRKSFSDDVSTELTSTATISSNSQPEEPPKKRGRGRPRKQPLELYTCVKSEQTYSKPSNDPVPNQCRKKNTAGHEFDDEDDDEDVDDDDDDEDDVDYR